MSEPITLADQNLVLNGDFTKGLDDWKKGPVSQDWLITQEVDSDSGRIIVLVAGNGASVSQKIVLPKDQNAEVRYFLKFLCETIHADPGKLIVSIEDKSERLEIDLLPGEPRDLNEDQARLAGGQPLMFKPRSYEVELDLSLENLDRVKIEIISPRNEPNDFFSEIHLTQIALTLHLGSLVLETLFFDGRPWSLAEPLPFCLGATQGQHHRVQCVPAPGNSWQGTRVAFVPVDNPSGAVVADPAWGQDHPLESMRTFDCPNIGDQEPYPFFMDLFNQYTAQAYRIAVLLGHHRLIFLDVKEAPHYLILDSGETVELGVQMASYYIRSPLGGVTVNWTADGQGVVAVDVTKDNGWAYFIYESTASGDFTVKATAVSPYYPEGVVTQDFKVRVLATDPWDEVLAVVEKDASPWPEKTGYPNRGSDYVLQVRFPDTLWGTYVWLHWRGDSHEQLGVGISPALGEPVQVTASEMSWTLTSEDLLDGLFKLWLSCSKLLRPSSEKNMSLARNLVKIGQVREANTIPVIDEGGRALLMVQVLHERNGDDGEPVSNALVDWKDPDGLVKTVRTGNGGWAGILYTPEIAGEQVVIASVKAHEEAVSIERTFNFRAIATSPWKNQVKILFNDVPVDAVLGLLCWRGQSHTLEVKPLAGSSWTGKSVSLNWRDEPPEIGLEASDLGTSKPLTEAGLQWQFTSNSETSLSRMFEMQLKTDGQPDKDLIGRLIHPDLTQEMKLLLDQVPADPGSQTLYPCLGAHHQFIFLLNPLSPLFGLSGALLWSGSSAEELGATVDPALGQPQVIDGGGPRWAVDFTDSEQPGLFGLALRILELEQSTPANEMVLGHNKVRIETLYEPAVDPVAGQDRAWTWVRVFSHFTGQAVEQVPVQWTALGDSRVVPTDADGLSGFGVMPVSAEPFPVTAMVYSPYDSYEQERSTPVQPLETDPLAALKVRFDGQEPRLMGEMTYFPRRKGLHSFEVLPAANSPLLGQKIMLGMTGASPRALDLRFTQGSLGMPKVLTVDGLQYQFKVGDLQDGGFDLRLAAERLASLSPANPMSVGRGSQVLKINVIGSVTRVLEWGQEFSEQINVVSTISGKPMKGVSVTFQGQEIGVRTSETNFYGLAEIAFTPQISGEGEVKVTVGDDSNSVSIRLTFFVEQPRKLIELVEITDDPGWGSGVRARVVSSFTQEPLKGVKVMWEVNNSTLPSRETDEDGYAWLNLIPAADGKTVVFAIVKGGAMGWGMLSLRYGGVVPVIESLTGSKTTIALGEEANAEIKVISGADGQPLKEFKVVWAISGRSLPATYTQTDGTSSILFTPTEPGEQILTATVGLGEQKSLTYDVRVVKITELQDDNSGILLLGSTNPLIATVQVPGAPPDTEIRWSFTELPDSHSYTDAGGQATCRFEATKIPDNNFARLSATVHAGTDAASSLSTDIWVNKNYDNPPLGGAALVVNDIVVVFPLIASGNVKPNRDIKILLKLFEDSRLYGQQVAIYCTRNDVTFMPPVGELRTIETELGWVMNVEAPVGSIFRFAISSPAFEGSTGCLFTVISEGAKDQAIIIEHDEICPR